MPKLANICALISGLCLSSVASASIELNGQWLLAGGGCWNEKPEVYKTQADEFWIFKDDLFTQRQNIAEGAEDPTCAPIVHGVFTLKPGSDPSSFRILSTILSYEDCTVKEKRGKLTIRVPQMNRLVTYDNATSVFTFSKFLGADALIEEVTQPFFNSCDQNRYRYYFIRPPEA